MELSLRKKTSKKWYTDSLTISNAILVFSLFVNLLSVYYVMTASRRVEMITINQLDKSVNLHGKITGKQMIGNIYTLDCGAYGKFLVNKEQYDSVQVGDDIPIYLKGRGQ